jgi:hypothetical protein
VKSAPVSTSRYALQRTERASGGRYNFTVCRQPATRGGSVSPAGDKGGFHFCRVRNVRSMDTMGYDMDMKRG